VIGAIRPDAQDIVALIEKIAGIIKDRAYLNLYSWYQPKESSDQIEKALTATVVLEVVIDERPLQL
jgi:hypothetical protein